MANIGQGGSRKRSVEGWEVGDRVFAFWVPDEYWYAATVKSVAGNKVEVLFDGETETDTLTDYYLDTLGVEVDDEIEAWSEDDEEYYYATVKAVKGEKVEVIWDDDESEEWLTIGDIRWWGYFGEGDRVWAYYAADEYWYPATVKDADEGTVTVVFDGDGKGDATALVYVGDPNKDEVDNLALNIGDEVEGWWAEDNKYYPAKVVAVKSDGSIQIEYKDGTQWTEIANLRMADE